MTPSNAPNAPVRVAVLGTGFGRTTQIPGFRATPGCEVVAVLSHRREKAESTAREFAIPHAFVAGDFDQLLAVEGLDLVCVTTPTDTHRAYTVEAFAAGKHVLCEKPTAMDAAEAREMAAAGRAARRLGLIDHELRFDPARRKLRDLVREGFLGTLYHVTIQVESPALLSPERPWSWWFDRTRGGGYLGAIASHVVDAVRYTFAEVESVRAQLETFILDRPDPDHPGRTQRVTADEYAALWLRLERGALANVLLSGSSRTNEPGWRMAAHGSQATLALDAEGRLWAQRQRETGFTEVTPERPPFDATALQMPDTPWSRAFVLYAKEIVGALSGGRTAVPEAATLEDGVRSQEVLDAARRSHEEATWVACGPTARVAGGIA